jgi:hypothetical protein
MSLPVKLYGKRIWAFAAGHIPLYSSGQEPAFTSHDKISVLNALGEDAEIYLQIFHEDRSPVTGYSLRVPARRIRKFRFNDLIDPLPLSLDTPYAFTLYSTIPVMVQFSRMLTGSSSAAGFCVTPLPDQPPIQTEIK